MPPRLNSLCQAEQKEPDEHQHPNLSDADLGKELKCKW